MIEKDIIYRMDGESDEELKKRIRETLIFPKYLTAGNCGGVRRSDKIDSKRCYYYRDGGRYHIIVRIKNGRFQYKFLSDHFYVGGVEECAEQEWRECNGEFIDNPREML